MRACRSNWTQVAFLAAFAWAAGSTGSAQTVIAGPSNRTGAIFGPSDAQVLDSHDLRKELPCTAGPEKPVLGFDMRFHAGYEFSVPLKELAGESNRLSVIFRVTPASDKNHPVHFGQRIVVPKIEEDARGKTTLYGGFDLGVGKYHIDWLVKDRRQRFCTQHWDMTAELTDRDRSVDVTLRPGEVRPFDSQMFRADPVVPKDPKNASLDVKLLVNFAPERPGSTVLEGFDVDATVGILRTINRDPRIGRVSLVAFSMQERRVLIREDEVSRIDFPSLGKAVDTLKLGAIDIDRLKEKDGDLQFLAELVRKETADDSRPDALIFAGPKGFDFRGMPQEIKETEQVPYPVFYLSYDQFPSRLPWRDTVGSVVRFFKGTEYTINRPRDLWFALKEIVSRISASKNRREARIYMP